MNTCPACSEEIKDDAKKCRHCHYLIEPNDQIFAKHPPTKQINLTLDSNLIRFSGAVVTVLTVFVVIFIAIYGFDLRNASLELERYQKTNKEMKGAIDQTLKANEEMKKTSKEARKTYDQILADRKKLKEEFDKSKDELAGLKKQAGEINAMKNSVEGDVRQLSDNLKEQEKLSALFKMRIGVLIERIGDPEAPNAQDKPENTLETALEQSKDNLVRLNELDKNLAEIRDQLVQGRVVALTETQKKDITKAIRVRQISEKSSVPRGRKDEGKDWHRLTFSVVVEPTNVGDIVIEKVIYHFDKRWWKDPSKVRINRRDNFAYTTRVWGSTSIDVEVFVKHFNKSLTATVLMNLVGRGDKADETYAVMQ